MPVDEKYAGIDKDLFGGMTPIGKIIRDAWVFELIDEQETCENWTYSAIDILMRKVEDEWDKYGCMVSSLPEELFKRHQEFHQKAFKRAKEKGWNGEIEAADDK